MGTVKALTRFPLNVGHSIAEDIDAEYNYEDEMKCIPACIVFLATAARASTITQYFDSSSFDAAVAGTLMVEDFTAESHFPIPTGVLNSSTYLPAIGLNPGDILPGVTYSTSVDDNSATSNEFNIDGGGGRFVGGFLDSLNLGSNRPLGVTFDSPVRAFGFDTNGSTGGTSQLVTIGEFVLTLSLPDSSTPMFFGFVSSGPDIGNVSVSSGGTSSGDTYGFAVDNFTFSQEAAPPTVPEANTCVLLLTGMLMLYSIGATARSRRRRQCILINAKFIREPETLR
jgi:hypothetical protein